MCKPVKDWRPNLVELLQQIIQTKLKVEGWRGTRTLEQDCYVGIIILIKQHGLLNTVGAQVLGFHLVSASILIKLCNIFSYIGSRSQLATTITTLLCRPLGITVATTTY